MLFGDFRAKFEEVATDFRNRSNRCLGELMKANETVGAHAVGTIISDWAVNP